MMQTELSLPHVRGVLLDMDGVLCESAPFLVEAGRRLFRDKYGTEVTHDDYLAFAGGGEAGYLEGVAGLHGIALDAPEDMRTLYALYFELIRGRLTVLPGVREFIARCRRRLLPVAVASSAARIKLEGNLREIGLPPEDFDAVVTGDELARPKPDPEVFLLAARRLALLPEDCLVVEDTPNGIAAARGAGCRCLAVTTTFGETELSRSGAEWVVADLSGVRPGPAASQPLPAR